MATAFKMLEVNEKDDNDGQQGLLKKGCCDSRTATLVVNMIAIYCKAFMILMIREDALFLGYGSTLEDFVRLLWWLVISLLACGCGIIGALRLDSHLVGAALMCHCIDSGVAFYETNVVGFVFALFLAYPNWLFILEVQDGVMSRENYTNVKYFSDYLIALSSLEDRRRNSFFWCLAGTLRNQIIVCDAIGAILGIGFIIIRGSTSTFAILAFVTAYISVFVCGIYGAIHEVKWMVGVAMIGYLPFVAILVFHVLSLLLLWPLAIPAGVCFLLLLFGILVVLWVYVNVGGTAHYLFMTRAKLE
jgi:hypothetical protein